MAPLAILQKIQSCGTDNPLFPFSGAHPALLHQTTSANAEHLAFL